MSATLTSPETDKDRRLLCLMFFNVTQIFLLEIIEESDDDPCITRDVLLSCLQSRGYIDCFILRRQFQIHNIDSNVFLWSPRRRIYCGHDMIFLFRELRDIPNGFQIFYRCLRETQDICRGHRILAVNLERNARKSEWEVIKALVIFFRRAKRAYLHGRLNYTFFVANMYRELSIYLHTAILYK